jgi:peptidyl-prolyl cis-trans isomerase A (cyclophilin A)
MRLLISRVFVTAILTAGLAAGVAAQAGDTPAPPPTPTLKDPSSLIEAAPDKYRVKFDTSAGEIVIEVEKDWAPRGATRFYNLVKNGYYDDCRFFRVMNNFMAQVGINGDPAISKVWRGAIILDDVRKQTNERSYVSFAAGGKNTRTTQIFINIKDNKALDDQNLVPFGKVVSGMNVVENLYREYSDKPQQAKIQAEGNAYLQKSFPKLDYIKKATIEE